MGVILCFAIFFGIVLCTGGNRSSGMMYAVLAIVMLVGLYVVAGGGLPVITGGIH